MGRNDRGHELGAGAIGALLRRVTGVEGEVELELEFAPRPEYGLIQPVLEVVDGGYSHPGRRRRARPVVARAAGTSTNSLPALA